MSVEPLVFVDTNVLIYARDQSAGFRHAAALHWLERLSADERMLLNLQVLNELVGWILRKEKAAVGVARESAEALRYFGDAPLGADDVERAWDVREVLGYQWFDCLLLASAANAGCTHFLSEDMGHETRYGSVTIINPFRVAPESILGKN